MTSCFTTLHHVVDVEKAYFLQKKKRFSFNMENMMIEFEFLPKIFCNSGSGTANVYNCSGWITIHYDSINCVDDRLVTISFECGDYKRTIPQRPIFCHGEKSGFSDLFQMDTITALKKSNYKIIIKIAIKCGEYCSEYQLPKMHKMQLNSLYHLNKTNGDLLLIQKQDNKQNKMMAMSSYSYSNDDQFDDKINENEEKFNEEKGNQSEIDDDVTFKSEESDENDNNQENKNGVRTSSVLLMSSSLIFKNILKEKEKENKIIEIECESIQIIDDLIYFITTGYLRENVDTLQLLKLSYFYQLKALNYACLDRLIIILNGGNLVDTINSFDTYSFNDKITRKLYGKLVEKFQKRREKIMQIVDVESIPIHWIAWIQNSGFNII